MNWIVKLIHLRKSTDVNGRFCTALGDEILDCRCKLGESLFRCQSKSERTAQYPVCDGILGKYHRKSRYSSHLRSRSSTSALGFKMIFIPRFFQTPNGEPILLTPALCGRVCRKRRCGRLQISTNLPHLSPHQKRIPSPQRSAELW